MKIFFPPTTQERSFTSKGGQVGTALLYSSCYGLRVIFEYIDKPLYMKNDSEWLA